MLNVTKAGYLACCRRSVTVWVRSGDFRSFNFMPRGPVLRHCGVAAKIMDSAATLCGCES